MKNTKEKLFKLSLFLFVAILSLFIWSCSDSTSPEETQGQILIKMVDSPADYDQVNIAVSRVEVHKANSDSSSGWLVINNTPAVYDLLTLRNGASTVLGNKMLDAGHYSQIRLIIGTGSNIVVDGNAYNLTIPSGMQSGVKLNHAFDIEAGNIYELMLDFDADHSIVKTGSNEYKLKPVIRLVPTIISGTISGTINPITSFATVSAIKGLDTVSTYADLATGSFKLMALLEGTYNINVIPTNVLYNDTTIVNVNVIAKQNTDLSTINLQVK